MERPECPGFRQGRQPRIMQGDSPLLLIVDDFEVVQRPYRYLLSLEGCRVDFAVSGQEAMDKALALQPDVIFMDISLPGIDGFEVTRRLKADQRTRAIPVVMLTAFGFESAPAEICDAGFASVLSKPCAPKVMIAEVARVLERKSTRL